MIKKWDIVGSLWDIVDDCTEYDSPCQGCSHFTSPSIGQIQVLECM
jgi:hypothetical protein